MFQYYMIQIQRSFPTTFSQRRERIGISTTELGMERERERRYKLKMLNRKAQIQSMPKSLQYYILRYFERHEQ